jgi:cytochrome c
VERVSSDIGSTSRRLKYAPAGMTTSALPSRFTLLLIALMLASLPVVSACDPYSDIKAELTDSERAVFQRGQRAATPCWTCHDLTGTGTKVGPHLSGVIGRTVGSLPSYTYSDVLQASTLVWDRRTLDAYLADVQGFAPGGLMVSPGVPNSGERAALIFFLEKVTPARSD